MKKCIAAILLVLMLIPVFPCSAESETDLDVNSDVSEVEMVEVVTGENDFDTGSTWASNLIVCTGLELAKTSDGKLVINALTDAVAGVTKCGFTYIKLQRMENGAWESYATYCYYDQYNDFESKTFRRTITPPKGYTYRLICEHYAEKPLLGILKSKQKLYNATSAMYY